ncbi:hypothetical protein [Dasineura jujubifolia toursvirus 2a]|nr:hypothetical protein [Dasineura jujubifolia toursvirus 2a]
MVYHKFYLLLILVVLNNNFLYSLSKKYHIKTIGNTFGYIIYTSPINYCNNTKVPFTLFPYTKFWFLKYNITPVLSDNNYWIVSDHSYIEFEVEKQECVKFSLNSVHLNLGFNINSNNNNTNSTVSRYVLYKNNDHILKNKKLYDLTLNHTIINNDINITLIYTQCNITLV